MNLKSVEPHLHGSQTEQESVAIFTLQAGFVINTQIKGMNMLSCSIFTAGSCCIDSYVFSWCIKYVDVYNDMPSPKSATSLA